MMQIREITYLSIVIRILSALVMGGIIGLERGMKNRPAGLRTYMLVTVGSCMFMLINQCIYQVYGTGDPVRMAAQVVSGIGFLGAGTIIVTARQEVKGLTTAAGLWASACTGLAIGAGFYEGVVLAFIMIVLCIMVFPILEDLTVANGRNMNIYVEFERLDDITAIVRYIKEMNIQIFDVDVDREKTRGVQQRPNAILSLRLPSRQSHTAVLARIATVENICAIEEI